MTCGSVYYYIVYYVAPNFTIEKIKMLPRFSKNLALVGNSLQLQILLSYEAEKEESEKNWQLFKTEALGSIPGDYHVFLKSASQDLSIYNMLPTLIRV